MRVPSVVLALVVLSAAPLARTSGPFALQRGSFLRAPQPPPGQSRPGTIGPPAPVQTASPRSPGTGTLHVRIASLAGVPLRRVKVTVDETSVAGTTDADGRVDLTVRAGRWVLSASRDGYLTLRSGQRTPRELPRPFLVDPGAILSLTMLLPHCGVLAGRVMDETGEPLAKVRVRASRYVWVRARRTLVPAGEADSNAAGLYSIAGLATGSYMLSAVRYGEVPAGETGFVPTYYPGTWDASLAAPVEVGPEDERAGLDFRLIPGRVARISGTVLDSRGRPAAPPNTPGPGQVSLLERITSDLPDLRTVATTQILPSGDFVLEGVPPGLYLLRAAAPVTGSSIPEVAALRMPVAQSDIDSVRMTLGAGGTVRGMVDLAGQAASGAPPAFSLVAVPADRPPSRDDPTVRVRPYSTFTLTGLVGPTWLRPAGLPADWAVKTIQISGRNYLDAPYDFQGIETLAARITLSDRVTEVGGTVVDDRGQPVLDYAVVVFPRNRRTWNVAARSLQAARPDQQGRFSVRNLPPGDYFAAVSMGLDAEEWSNPDFLEQLAARAVPFSLSDGEAKVLTLKLTVGT